jgi:hypothetical protein
MPKQRRRRPDLPGKMMMARLDDAPGDAPPAGARNNRLSDDSCNFEREVVESMSPGVYRLSWPVPLRDDCWGGARSDSLSSLRNAGAPLTRDCPDAPARGPGGDHCPPPGPVAETPPGLLQQHGRATNPPSTLKGRGIWRWDPLLEDPQLRTRNEPRGRTSERRRAIDSHVPCSPAPLDQTALHPPQPPAPPVLQPPPEQEVSQADVLPTYYGGVASSVHASLSAKAAIEAIDAAAVNGPTPITDIPGFAPN